MTTDDFLDTARAEAEVQCGNSFDLEHFMAGAVWARAHLAAQDPTDAEVEAGMTAAGQSMPAAWWGGTEWRRYVEEILSAASATRRDEENR